MIHKFFALMLIIAGSSQALAQDDTRQVADGWLDAYTSQDFDAMRGLLTEESRFIDPSSFGREGFSQEINWTGPDAILSGIQEWGVSRAVYTFENVFSSPGRVVYRGSIDVTFGQSDPQIRMMFPIITIISVENGRVMEHRDYTDYDAANVVSESD